MISTCPSCFLSSQFVQLFGYLKVPNEAIMKLSRILILLISGFYFTNSEQYYDTNDYTDCFQGAPGWYHISATCLFPLTQFERNYSIALQMCGSVNHSIGYRETNWLIAEQLFNLFENENLRKIYWTGLRIDSTTMIGVESSDVSRRTSPFTSIYNPLWASGQPAETMSETDLLDSCLALDLRNPSNFGWKPIPCHLQLPILCQNYACLPNTFRCADNSKCIPSTFRNDGFDDCLDGSDESEVTGTTASLIQNSQKMFDWPMEVSSGGMLTPFSVRYGSGECTHRWTVLSPNDRHFVIGIKWMTPTTSTTIFVEGKDQNGTMFITSRNSTSSFSLQSSSFVLTASETDTRRSEFQVFYQEIDNSLCKISEDNRLIYTSKSIPMSCNYQFSTKSSNSYTILLIRQCEGNQKVSLIEFNNSSLILTPSSTKKLLILPTSHLNLHVNSTWPDDETRLDIQFFELTPSGDNVDIFMIDREFEVEWKQKSSDIWMEGDFRTLSVSMIMTEKSENSTWNVAKFGKTCEEDNIQLVSALNSTFVRNTGSFQSNGPTSLIIHQSAEPFELHAFYRIQEDIQNVKVYDEEVSTTTTTVRPVKKVNETVCKLPIVRNGYVDEISDLSYTPGTSLTISCFQGYHYPNRSVCQSSGLWSDQSFICDPIQCPSVTPVERVLSLIPDNYKTDYGTVRKYANLKSLSFGPFCVCGDDEMVPNDWKCYNYQSETSNQIEDACILPQVNDAKFNREDSLRFDVFPTGYNIQMNCLLCPSMLTVFICQKGLWYTSDGKLQPYDTFQCKCSEDPDFIDPCKPHGSYVQLSGGYTCKCDAGFKMIDGTCKDIDECAEQSDYCDWFATCLNLEGSFECVCPSSFHIFTNDTSDFSHWSSVSQWLIPGFSCVETTCDYDINLEQYGLQVIYPPNMANSIRTFTTTDYGYVTNLCNSEFDCVVPFRYTCLGNTLMPDRNLLSVCLALDPTVYTFDVISPLAFHVFEEVPVQCKVPEKIMIGRPTVFCNTTAQWEQLPVCIYQSCSDPTQFIQSPLIIDHIRRPFGNQFEYNTALYLKCEDGYTLIGESIITCVLDGTGNIYWNYDLPRCVSDTTEDYSSTMEPSSSSSASTSESYATTTYGIFHDDIVIEDSVVFEETNILQQKDRWMNSADWHWTSSLCVVHQWTFPTSFLVTSSSVLLNSEEIELVVDVDQCQSSFQVSVSTSDDGFIPSISEFRAVLNTTSSGSFVVKLRNLKSHLAVSITASGFVKICGVSIREKRCGDVQFDEVKLTASKPFSMRKYITATCSSNRITTVNGFCDIRRGWVIRNPTCVCNPCQNPTTLPPIVQRDQSTICTWNSCSNGVCKQFDGYFECVCNEYFIMDYGFYREPYCKPNHCLLTSRIKNSGYDCSTGEDDYSIKCDNSSRFGKFCQYENRLTNSSYVYMLPIESEVAVATDVCLSPDTYYAIPNPLCTSLPTSTVGYDGCSLCSGSSTCDRTQPPYEDGAYCLCDNSDEYGRSCTSSKFCVNDDGTYRCQNGGTCLRDQKMCACLPNFSGEMCETYIENEICETGVKDCVNGNCRSEYPDVYCNCYDGWIRDVFGNCTVRWDMCSLNNPCQQNSDCSFNSTSGELKCDCEKSKWQGSYCQIAPKHNDCSVCENSSGCLDVFTDSVRCKCTVGYSGEYCTEDIDDCHFQPCFNNGICQKFNYEDPNTSDFIEFYNCTCPSGFSGTNCELVLQKNCSDFIECDNGGTCTFDENGNAICQCTPQFYGVHCERKCSEQCAHSYGCVQINNGSVFCECFDGFSSQYCDVVDDVCKANVLLCQNSGSCNSDTQSCDCTGLYYGTYCENNRDVCVTNSITCENGGTCRSETGECNCPPGFTGHLCENQLHSCSDITCFNGGTCISYNGTCACLPGSTGDRCQDLGQPCQVLLPNGTVTDYCMNGGKCLNLPNGAACDCNGTEYSGRRCETKVTANFNLVFNGLNYAPDIVSKSFSNPTIAQFTLCSFVQYNHPTGENTHLPPYLSMRGYGNSQQIIFDNNGFYICDVGKRCDRAENNFKSIPISANTWHHFCLVSPENQTSPSYTVYLDGVKMWDQYAQSFNPGEYGYLYLAPSNLTEPRFEGMISMTQLYIIRLTEAQIGKLAFDCLNTIGDDNSEFAPYTLVNWKSDFTRVSSSNPGVFVDPSGICSSVKCMFGRQGKMNNYNSTGSCDKDRISPTVLRCPSTIRRKTTRDFTKVEWSDEDILFFDNIGVVRIDANYQNGQQFGIGITAVRYVAFDAAGNSAECSFDIIVSQNSCPTNIEVDGGTFSIQYNVGPFVNSALTVKCTDELFPCNDRPKFYTCDIMGNYNYGGWKDGNRYYLPACGVTQPALQAINGTVVGTGSCQQVYQKLRDVIWSAANCDEISSCRLIILPPCNSSQTSIGSANVQDNVALQYSFSTRNATETVNSVVYDSLQSNFSFVRQDSSITCDSDFPIYQSDGNRTICVSCPQGTYADQTSNQCLDCPLNTYRNSSSTNQLECDHCPGNTITGTLTGAIDDSQCYTNCDVGQFESNGLCVPCPEGTFNSEEGSRKCTCCSYDTSTFGGGKTSSSDCIKICEPGQEMIRDEYEMTPICVDCAIGYYKSENYGSCIQCPRGLTTASNQSKTIDDCNLLNCIDANTMRNLNSTIGPDTPYSELCITCAQGQFQNVSNADSCLSCSELSSTVTDIPITCQSTCSAEIPTDGCNCQLQESKNSIITRNCVPEVVPNHQNSSAIKIVLPIVFGVLLLIVMVVLYCFRKEVIAWFRKSNVSDNQHVAPSHWDRLHTGSQRSIIERPPPPTIPRPNLRIVTSREELDQLPPLPSSSTPSFHVDSAFKNGSSGISSANRNIALTPVFFEANGSPKIVRSPLREPSDDSSLDSFF